MGDPCPPEIQADISTGRKFQKGQEQLALSNRTGDTKVDTGTAFHSEQIYSYVHLTMCTYYFTNLLKKKKLLIDWTWHIVANIVKHIQIKLWKKRLENAVATSGWKLCDAM